MTKPGVLALWSDCAAGREAELEQWCQSEHLAERVAIPGFRRARRYDAIEARQQYFTYYETDTPDVLISPAYRERLDNPSPLTQTIMSGVIVNMSRTICCVERQIGEFRGPHAVAVKLSSVSLFDGANFLETLAVAPGVARVELWTVAEEIALPASDEEKLRGGDERIEACLFVETLRAADAREAAQVIAERLGDTVDEIGFYRLLCELAK